MKYIRRFLWFMASKMLVFTLISSILVLAFYLSINAANIYVLLSDGMRQRTEVILTREGDSLLRNYFMDEFLHNDAALKVAYNADSPYQNYDITGFDSEVTLEWIWSWPWAQEAQATIVYRVPSIRGSVLSSKSALVKSGQLTSSPPQWQGGRYEMSLVRVRGQWKIVGMRQTQVIVDATPAPKPTVSPTTAP